MILCKLRIIVDFSVICNQRTLTMFVVVVALCYQYRTTDNVVPQLPQTQSEFQIERYYLPIYDSASLSETLLCSAIFVQSCSSLYFELQRQRGDIMLPSKQSQKDLPNPEKNNNDNNKNPLHHSQSLCIKLYTYSNYQTVSRVCITRTKLGLESLLTKREDNSTNINFSHIE